MKVELVSYRDDKSVIIRRYYDLKEGDFINEHIVNSLIHDSTEYLERENGSFVERDMPECNVAEVLADAMVMTEHND